MLWKLCPYANDRIARGLSVDGSFGPDAFDMDSHRLLASSAGIQHRRDTFASGRQKLIPFGLTDLEHVSLATSIDSPLASLPPLPDDLAFAARKSAALGEDIDAWREEQWTLLDQNLCMYIFPAPCLWRGVNANSRHC